MWESSWELLSQRVVSQFQMNKEEKRSSCWSKGCAKNHFYCITQCILFLLLFADKLMLCSYFVVSSYVSLYCLAISSSLYNSIVTVAYLCNQARLVHMAKKQWAKPEISPIVWLSKAYMLISCWFSLVSNYAVIQLPNKVICLLLEKTSICAH